MIQQATRGTPRMDLGEALHEYDSSGQGFIAMDVLPARGVTKKAATVSVITRENKKRADAKHANGGGFNRIGLTAEDLSYACVDYGLESPLTDVDRENYSSDFDAEVETVDLVQSSILVEREIRVAAMAFNTTIFTGSDLYTDNSSAPWDDIATKIINQVAAAMEKIRRNTGVKPDSMAIGAVSFNNLRKNTEIKDMFSGATVITAEMIRTHLASILDLQNLFVGGDVYDSAKEGQSFTAADIWSDDYALIFKQHSGNLKTPGLGRSYQWEPFGGEEVAPVQYREEQTESDIFRVRDFVDEKVHDSYFGHLLKIDA
ncbi:MAG: hypothetical protein KAT00_14510 [Planctomycetes bacterium]|nr:hypothetical protein [Planctomycetota bacterium]